MTAITVFLQREGSREVSLIEFDEDARVADILGAAVAQQIAIAGDPAALVFIENGDDALPVGDTLRHAGVGHHRSVHVHRCRRIAVTVHFNGKTVERAFTPAATVGRVKAWATGTEGFKLTPVDAAEHALQVRGTTDRPDEDVHIGTLVTAGAANACALAFDLVAKVRVEG